LGDLLIKDVMIFYIPDYELNSIKIALIGYPFSLVEITEI
jgi:hypothetical protein